VTGGAMAPSPLATTAAVALGVFLLVRAGALVIALLQPLLARSRPKRADRPGVSVLVPVKVVDDAFEAALRSLLDQDYPLLEIVICGDAQSAAAFAAARAIVGEAPAVPVVFATATEIVGPNPKITNLAAAVKVARHELLLIKDSNAVLERGGLADLVGELHGRVGMVCAIPIATEPEGIAAETERAMMNGQLAPLVLAGSSLTIDIGYGKVMLVRRADFDAIDGIRVMAPHFGDDHALAMALAARGQRTAFAALPVRQPLHRRRFSDVADRQLRWMVIRREQAFLALFAEPFMTAAFVLVMAWVGAADFGVRPWSLVAGTAAFWVATELGFQRAKGWGVAPASLAGMALREILIPVLWVRAWFTRRVTWRGASFDVADPAA